MRPLKEGMVSPCVHTRACAKKFIFVSCPFSQQISQGLISWKRVCEHEEGTWLFRYNCGSLNKKYSSVIGLLAVWQIFGLTNAP